jgi:DNA-binding SARP family transcriptional activator/tetratricopeptide (TPR) repeat protein
MEFRILGSLEAESGGRSVPLSGHRERRVLAALVLDAGRVVPVPRLIDVIWDDDPPATAGKQVRNAVSALRQALRGAGGGDLIATTPGGYRLATDGCTVDARVFEAGVAAAARAASEGKTAEAAGLLRSALAMWRGPALAGLTGQALELAAAAWEERRVAAQEICLDLELALGRHREILGELAALAAGYPLREKLAGLYMLALYRCGRQADALAAYQATQELLADQIGLDPGPELLQLQRQILTADPALAPPGTAPMEAGYTEGSPVPAAGAAHSLAAVPQVRYGLPADTAAFTGRGGELGRIMAAVRDAAGGGGVVAVGAIDGMPGVGKTALAVHVAHMLAGEYPDRQLFIDLHAHTPGYEPVQPGEALAGLLAAVGVDTRYLPGDLDGRAAMWRDRLAGQRALLVLDNAASSGQVIPLLPGGAGCLVLVTSRRHLGDLPGAITPVLVDALPPQEAADMFTRLAPGTAGDRKDVAEVVGLAGFLPLAICLLARVFARHPSWTLGDLAGETRARLLTLTAENNSVAAAFEVSYQHLDPGKQRFFQLLGVHPGTTADAYAAAAVAGTSLDEAAGYLEALYGERLLTEIGYGRYGMHDLIRRYARNLAAADTPTSSQQALGRVLDYYQHTAALADKQLARKVRPGPEPAAPGGSAVPVLDGAGPALAWARVNRASVLACLDLVIQAGQHARVVALTAGLASVLKRDGFWAQASTHHAAALAAARRLGDQLGEANALSDLGEMRRLTGDPLAAAADLEEALGIYRDLGSRQGQANVLTDFGEIRWQAGDYPRAVGGLEEALSIYRDLGDQLGEATALTYLGNVRHVTGDYPDAVKVFEEALEIYQGLGDQLGRANALTDFGVARQMRDDYVGAAGVLEEALGIYRDLSYPLGEANALLYIGVVRRLRDDYPGVAEIFEEALGIFRDLGHRLGEANTLFYLGEVRQLTAEYPGAAQVLGQALGIYHDLGTRIGEANTLHQIGTVRRLTGDHLGAARALEEALGLYRDLGDQPGEGITLDEQGTLYRVSGDLTRAQECHQQALELARAIGISRDEARALAGLGRCAIATGDTTQAEALLRQAHQIFQQIGAAESHDLLAELDALTAG